MAVRAGRACFVCLALMIHGSKAGALRWPTAAIRCSTGIRRGITPNPADFMTFDAITWHSVS